MDSSRIGLVGHGCVVMILAACAGCGSSSSSPGTPSDGGSGSSSGGSSGSSSGGSSGGTPVLDGDGGACTITYPVTMATLITVNVTWLATSATAKGSGKQYISLLTVYSADSSNKITGTTTTCGTVPADITLSDLGVMATGVPPGSMVRVEFPAGSWDGIPSTNITGTLGGTNIGSSFAVDPVVTFVGISPSDPLKDATKAWPPLYSAITDLTYIDGGAYVMGMGQPGVAGVFFSNASPFVLPRTALSSTSPQVDRLHSASRTALSLYGTSTSCMETTGKATVTQLNNHVVGCDKVNDGGVCTTDEFGFLDSNTTQYTPGAATFDAKQIASGAKCSDVLTALPLPAPGM